MKDTDLLALIGLGSLLFFSKSTPAIVTNLSQSGSSPALPPANTDMGGTNFGIAEGGWD